MNRDDALDWLRRKLASADEPALTEPELESLLDEVAPGAVDYDLTTLNRAAAEGWGDKAAAAVENYGPESDIYKHCVEQRTWFSARAVSGGAVRHSREARCSELLI